MYAIVDIAGQQMKVEEGQEIYVHRLQAEKGEQVSFDQVLLIESEGNVNIGSPVIAAAGVKASVLDHVKGDKVIVFKKKRRKGYQVKNGHRQQFTKIKIDSINV
jgi:large subunit ribosomal protein L21